MIEKNYSEKEIINRINEIKKEKNVVILVHNYQSSEIYKIADVYVMPSVSEPFGLTPLEAMKNGTPVLLSKDAGVCEVINHCLKVDFWNTDEIASNIISLLEKPEQHKQLSINGKKEIAKFCWNKVAEKCIKIYSNILKEKVGVLNA